LIEKYGPVRIAGFLKKYTDLDVGWMVAATSDENLDSIPCREEMSGGAYINSRENLKF
jgi:hypothetical protein